LGAALYLARRTAAWNAASCVCAYTFPASAHHSDGAMMMLAPVAKSDLLLPLRLAWRELRGGLRGFGVFIVCIALGVLAIAGVGSVAASLADGIASARSATRRPGAPFSP